MERINFENGVTKVNEDTFNEFQDNIEEACVYTGATEPETSEKVWLKKGKNLFNKASALRGFELNGTTGATITNNDWYVSDYIQVNPNTEYYLSGNKTSGASNVFYDENYTYISSVNNLKTGLITSPNNAKYLRFNGTLAEIDNNIQLEQNSEATTYEPYIEKKILTKNNNDVFEEFTTGEVIQSGSNTNGSWVKYPDGTMICWFSIVVTDQAINTLYASGVYQGTREWVYPVPFIDKPSCQCTTFHYGSSASWGSCFGTSATTAYLRGYDFFARNEGTNCEIAAIAIGRWK